MIDRNIHDCLNAGIPVHLFFMIGFPTETKEEALNTLAYTENVLNYSKQVCGVHIFPREDFTNFGLVMGVGCLESSGSVWCLCNA